MAKKQLWSGSGKFSSAKKIAKSKRSREHLALAHKLNENNESIVGTFNSDKTPKFIIEGCRIVDLKYIQEQITGGCSVCQKTLKLDNITSNLRIVRQVLRLSIQPGGVVWKLFIFIF